MFINHTQKKYVDLKGGWVLCVWGGGVRWGCLCVFEGGGEGMICACVWGGRGRGDGC